MSIIIEKAQAALAGDPSAADLGELREELETYVGGRTARLKEITTLDKTIIGGGLGLERRKAVDSADIKAVAALDDEERALGPELSILRNLQSRVADKLDATQQREWVAGAPDLYKQAERAQAAEAKLRAELSEAKHLRLLMRL